MFLLAIFAVFGNLGQLQLKYDHCKEVKFEGEYCKVQKVLSEQKKPSEVFNFYRN